MTKCFGYWQMIKDIRDKKIYIDKKTRKQYWNPSKITDDMVTGKEGIKIWCKYKTDRAVQWDLYTLETYELILKEVKNMSKNVVVDKSQPLQKGTYPNLDLCKLSELAPGGVLREISQVRDKWFDNKTRTWKDKPNKVIQTKAIREFLPKLVKGEKLKNEDVKIAKAKAREIKPEYELVRKEYSVDKFNNNIDRAREWARSHNGYLDDPPIISKDFFVIYEKVEKWK